MPPTPRRPVPPPSPPPAPAAPSPNAAPKNPEDSPGNTIEPDMIYTSDGLTALDALRAVLGPDGLTGNNQVDANAAIKKINQWRQSVKHWESALLHLKYNDYARRGDRRPGHERNNWLWVAGDLKMPPTTVHQRAHAVPCFDSMPDEPS
jgi:hypothetical protein